jgi:hypothetical protein
MSILNELNLKGLDRLLVFDEMGHVQIKSDKAGTFLVKLHTHKTFWQKLQEEFVKNELLWESNPQQRATAHVNIREMFDSLVKLLMIFDEDLMNCLLSQNFFSTFQSICQFVLTHSGKKVTIPPSFEEYHNEQQIICGPLFSKITEEAYRQKFFKMKYLYQYYFAALLPEIKSETLIVFAFCILLITRDISKNKKPDSCNKNSRSPISKP